jgi:hypothetical protein
VNAGAITIEPDGHFTFSFQVPIPGVVHTLRYYCTATDSGGRTATSTVPYNLGLGVQTTTSPLPFNQGTVISVVGTRFLPGSTITSITIRCAAERSQVVAASVIVDASGGFNFTASMTFGMNQGEACTITFLMFGATWQADLR